MCQKHLQVTLVKLDDPGFLLFLANSFLKSEARYIFSYKVAKKVADSNGTKISHR